MLDHRMRGTDEAALVRTPAFARIDRAAEFVVPRQEILLVHGANGTGKRTAVADYLARQPLAHVTLDLDPCRSGRQLVNALHDLVIAPDDLPLRDQQDDLVQALGEQDRIVVIHHAQRLTTEAAGQLQYLHARPNRRWALILVGDEGTSAVVGRDSLLLDDLAEEVAVTPLKGAELTGALQSMHMLFLGADPALLEEIDSRVCHGNLGRWSRFLQHAIARRDEVVAQGGDSPVLTRTFAKAVLARLPRTRKPR
jgi:hypothetical protein